MNRSQLREELQNIDIYLLDQILKGRYGLDDKILDAGCGGGRNLFWLLNNGYDVFGIDAKKEAVASLLSKGSQLGISINPNNFLVGDLGELEFDDGSFDHVICSAVLHFAKSHQHFKQMFSQLVRILKPGGSIFIRMTSNIGIENRVEEMKDGVHHIPDGSIRYLLTKEMLQEIMTSHQLSFLEPLKTVNVDDVRCMSTLMLKK